MVAIPNHPSSLHTVGPFTARARLQRGVYALEWAIIFPVFFMLLYAIISYGLTFLVRESMQRVAEDGARAVLQYHPTRDARVEAAQAMVAKKMQWLPAAIRPNPNSVNVRICKAMDANDCASNLACGMLLHERCMVHLDFSIHYAASPLVPGLRLMDMEVLNPETLFASASILVDRGGL
ncbi:pilus assembly protein [Lampropedia puyangensis]|uniref:Pilus assembly protein n=1 Tax=Lampropedia puyangensis TaxID=1330072 RepID=A0A4S8F450_9BURK|nr:TadE/TadG family type IV pilus assembly protein [Lampropedia puyangensis]THT99961.1 pilus assembly protein [Lampropedia puyangensis]